jgi:hypothetical protein
MTIEWSIDYEGDQSSPTPLQAAVWAWNVLEAPKGNLANAFTVIDEDGDQVRVDLEYDRDEGNCGPCEYCGRWLVKEQGEICTEVRDNCRMEGVG